MAYQKRDAIEESVRRQLTAFTSAGAKTFKVQCVPDGALRGQPRFQGTGKLHPWHPWTWTSEETIQNLKMLKRRNLEGYNIFIAPLPVTVDQYAPLVFIDDILPDALRKMKADGIVPAVLIESSKEKYQGWVRVNSRNLTASEIMRIQRILVDRYALDAGAIGAEQNGRLAGFRNVKLKYLNETRFAKLIEANEYAVGMDLISKIETASKNAEVARNASMSAESSSKSTGSGKPSSKGNISSLEQLWIKKVGAKSKPSASEQEFSACLACLRKGYSVEQVEDVLFRLGEDLIERKRTEAEAWAYVRRTVGKAAKIIEGS